MKIYEEMQVASVWNSKNVKMSTQKFVKNVVCNKCECQLWGISTGDTIEPIEFVEVNKWGELHLCKSCYGDVVKTFKIPVDEPSQQAQEQL